VRDPYSRILFGARLSLLVGIVSVGFAIVIGSLLGATSGYLGGWTDHLLMGLMDIMLAFPSLILAIGIVTVLGPGLINTLLAIGIVSIPVYGCGLCAPACSRSNSRTMSLPTDRSGFRPGVSSPATFCPTP
jgi:ABC-type dipeptide/oligopeptide/nickel transport system permease subunit